MWNNNQEEFDKNEEIGRGLFEDFVNQLKHKTEWIPSYIDDPLDGIIKQEGRYSAAVEIKTRYKGYEKFYSYYMELNKYINIKIRAKEEGCNTIWYVCFFGDDSLYIFDFRKFNPTKLSITKKWVLKATSDPSRGYEYKNFIEIPKKFAMRYKKINDKWRKVL